MPNPIKIPTFGLKKSAIARPHNWLIHHYFWVEIEEKAPLFSGRVLDIGCGRKPYWSLIEPYCEQYVGIDMITTLHGLDELDVIGSGLNLPFPAECFDVVVSFQVLEHVPEPSQFLAEANRVLKPGGSILLMTPFIWGEHEQPFDFYRYTRFGLKYLLEKAGFETHVIKPYAPFWIVSIVRFNYWLLSFASGVLKYPVTGLMWFNQFLALGLNYLSKWLSRANRPVYAHDYGGFTSVAKKREA